MGMPNYGYDWTLPYRPGTAARTVTNIGAINLAASNNARIQYDATSQAPFFITMIIAGGAMSFGSMMHGVLMHV